MNKKRSTDDVGRDSLLNTATLLTEGIVDTSDYDPWWLGIVFRQEISQLAHDPDISQYAKMIMRRIIMAAYRLGHIRAVLRDTDTPDVG